MPTMRDVASAVGHDFGTLNRVADGAKNATIVRYCTADATITALDAYRYITQGMSATGLGSAMSRAPIAAGPLPTSVANVYDWAKTAKSCYKMLKLPLEVVEAASAWYNLSQVDAINASARQYNDNVREFNRYCPRSEEREELEPVGQDADGQDTFITAGQIARETFSCISTTLEAVPTATDTVSFLADKGLINLTSAAATAVAATGNAANLATGIWGVVDNSIKLSEANSEKKITQSTIQLIRNICYIALAVLGLVSIIFAFFFAPWIFAILAGVALTCAIAGFFHDKIARDVPFAPKGTDSTAATPTSGVSPAHGHGGGGGGGGSAAVDPASASGAAFPVRGRRDSAGAAGSPDATSLIPAPAPAPARTVAPFRSGAHSRTVPDPVPSIVGGAAAGVSGSGGGMISGAMSTVRSAAGSVMASAQAALAGSSVSVSASVAGIPMSVTLTGPRAAPGGPSAGGARGALPAPATVAVV